MSMSVLQISALEFEKLLLLIMRVGGILVVAPIFSHRSIPALLKIGLIILVSLIILPTISSIKTELPPDLLGLAVILIKEIAAGLIIGFTAQLLFIGVQFAGDLIGLQMGFGIVNVMDPNSEAQVPLIGQLQVVLATLIFLALDGHHMVLSAIGDSLNAIPLGQINFTGSTADVIVRGGVGTLAQGIKLGAPCIVTLFLMDIAMGVVARTVPQMNIFIVGFPLKIGGGLLMLSASLPLFAYVFAKLLGNLDTQINSLIATMRPL
jgi:flagellar biosynthetic protein FliR